MKSGEFVQLSHYAVDTVHHGPAASCLICSGWRMVQQRQSEPVADLLQMEAITLSETYLGRHDQGNLTWWTPCT